MAESELIKESRKAALRRTDKMYEKNKKKIESLKKDYKDADFTEDDYIKGRDSTITGIKKDIRGSKAEGGLMEATARLKRQGLLRGCVARGCGRILKDRTKVTKRF